MCDVEIVYCENCEVGGLPHEMKRVEETQSHNAGRHLCPKCYGKELNHQAAEARREDDHMARIKGED